MTGPLNEWDDPMEASLHQRLEKLEAKVNEQETQIEGLRAALADLLVAYALNMNDYRVLAKFREYRDYDFKRAQNGGNERVSADFFAARGEMFANILTDAADTTIYSEYWERSALDWLDEKRYQRIKSVQKKIEGYADQ